MPSEHRRSPDDGDSGDPDHLAESRPGDPSLARALALVRHLRRHCPWDARQTPRTLVPYLLEEADETADAILREDADGLRDELGDLLLNVAFQIVLAEEEDAFGPREVVAHLEEKMRVRHPHVYGDAEAPPDWEETKGRTGTGPGEDRARTAPSTPLADALRTQGRAARVGFDWPEPAGAVAKAREELAELSELLEGAEGGGGEAIREEAIHEEAIREEAIREEVGDLLFAAVNVARLAGVDPEPALRRATDKFRTRFRRLLRLAERRGMDPVETGIDDLEALWREVKEAP